MHNPNQFCYLIQVNIVKMINFTGLFFSVSPCKTSIFRNVEVRFQFYFTTVHNMILPPEQALDFVDRQYQ